MNLKEQILLHVSTNEDEITESVSIAGSWNGYRLAGLSWLCMTMKNAVEWRNL